MLWVFEFHENIFVGKTCQKAQKNAAHAPIDFEQYFLSVLSIY